MKRAMLPAMVAALMLSAMAADAPHVKEGYWSIHTESVDNPGAKKTAGTYSLCRDHAYDQAARDRAKNMKGCTPVSENRVGSKYTVETRCTFGATVVESKAVTTFESDTAFHSESHGTYNPPLNGVSEMTLIQDQKYIGTCPAGVQPGDRVNADGSIMHLGKAIQK